MSSASQSLGAEQAEMAERVADFLRQHPDFLSRHPAVLAELDLTHEAGGAVSLLERQVAALREQNRELRHRFRELVNNARENEDLGRRLHQLTVRLIQAADVREVLSTLEESLMRDFRVERVGVLLFGPPCGQSGPQFRGPRAPERAPFESVLAQRRPVCGRLRRAQVEAAFGAEVGIGSGVVVPLAGGGWDGVLVVGAEDPQRYYADMGTEMLSHLGDIASLVMDRFLRA